MIAFLNSGYRRSHSRSCSPAGGAPNAVIAVSTSSRLCLRSVFAVMFASSESNERVCPLYPIANGAFVNIVMLGDLFIGQSLHVVLNEDIAKLALQFSDRPHEQRARLRRRHAVGDGVERIGFGTVGGIA